MIIDNYLGPVTDAKIVDMAGFESLNEEKVYIRREFVLEMSDGVRLPFANPWYDEFTNSVSGRRELNKSGISPNLINAVMLIWGKEPIVPDTPEL